MIPSLQNLTPPRQPTPPSLPLLLHRSTTTRTSSPLNRGGTRRNNRRLSSGNNRFGSRVRGKGSSKGRRGRESMPMFDHVLCEEFALGFGDAEFEGGGLAGAVSCGEGSCALGGYVSIVRRTWMCANSKGNMETTGTTCQPKGNTCKQQGNTCKQQGCRKHTHGEPP